MFGTSEFDQLCSCNRAEHTMAVGPGEGDSSVGRGARGAVGEADGDRAEPQPRQERRRDRALAALPLRPDLDDFAVRADVARRRRRRRRVRRAGEDAVRRLGVRDVCVRSARHALGALELEGDALGPLPLPLQLLHELE